MPSISRGAVPLARDLDSRWLILGIYRWYRTLSPKISLTVDSSGMSVPPPSLSCLSSLFPPKKKKKKKKKKKEEKNLTCCNERCRALCTPSKTCIIYQVKKHISLT